MTWDLLALRGLKVIKAFKEKLVRRDHRVYMEMQGLKGFRESRVYREKLVQPELMELTGIRC